MTNGLSISQLIGGAVGCAKRFSTIILFLSFFVCTVYAQDSYTVIVRCPIVKAGTSIISSTYSVTYNRYHPDYSASVTGASYSYSTGELSVGRTYTTTLTYWGPGNSYHSSWSTLRQSIGFVNFNIGGIPNCLTALGATMTLNPEPPDLTKNYIFTIYGLNSIPTTNNASNWDLLTNAPSNGTYNYYTTKGNASYSIGMWNTYTYTDNTSLTEYSVSSTYSTNTWYYRFFHNLASARANNITSFGMAFSNSGHYTWNSSSLLSSFKIKSNSLTLAVKYAAPWSCVLTLSPRPNTSSVCANSGVFTLSASQSYNTNYFSLSPTSWRWYSATASSGPYNEMGGTTASTYAVTAPSNTGSVWYRFSQSVRFVSNSTLTTLSNSYSISYCNPGSIYVSQCCLPLGSNPTFSGTQVSDRSVTLTWNGMGSNVDHFVIRYGTEGGVSFEEINVPRSATSTTINELTNGHTYYFQIRAISSSSDYCDTPLSTKVPLTPVCNE